MMVKDVLLEQFSACYDENGWFVAVRNALDGLTADEALWKPEGSNNSIWETLAHLTFYNYAYVERFRGIDYVYPTDSNDETFAAGSTEEEWLAAIECFDAVMREFRRLIEDSPESKLLETVSPTRTDLWASLISHINAHNAYHGGQILLLRKLRGAWDPARGVS